MNHTNPAAWDADCFSTFVLAEPVGPLVLPPARPPSRPATGCPMPPHPAAALELREDREQYGPDFPSGKGAEADRDLEEAADAETEPSRDVMSLLDEAVNLVSVLLASMEEDGDERSEQAGTVLRLVEKKLNKAHRRVDRQESRHRDLFVAYGKLKGRSERDTE